MLKEIFCELAKPYNVIVANGELPARKEFLSLITKAQNLISCDGATKHLLKHKLEPTIIIGDCDSMTKDLMRKFHHKIITIAEQNNNDLSKALNWVHANNLDNIIILGATGMREDHTIANIGLLTEYAEKFSQIYLFSSYGLFTVHKGKSVVTTLPGQQISYFAIQNNTQITATGLKWPLKNFVLKNWHCGTLNQATTTKLTMHSTNHIILYRSFEIKLTQ